MFHRKKKWKGNKLELKMGLKSNLIFSSKKNREIDDAKKNKW